MYRVPTINLTFSKNKKTSLHKIFNSLLNRKIPKVVCQYWRWLGFYSKYAPLTLTTFQLQPRPEPCAGGPELGPLQLLEAENDVGLQLGHSVACRLVTAVSLQTAPKGFIEFHQKMKQICKFSVKMWPFSANFGNFEEVEKNI